MPFQKHPKDGIAQPQLHLLNDPKHWRDRAEEARTMAERMMDDYAKEAMMRIADEYDRLADQAEQRQQLN
jgi:predicted Rossmann-fold nucleotide-binding protein